MHPIKLLKERRKSNVLKSFSKTKYSKMLREFKDIHSGEACFIIGNGPSLSAKDLITIHKSNIPSFAFNRIYLMFGKTDWRPTYFISQDEKTLKNCVCEVNEMNLKYKFIPLNLHYYYDIDIDNAFYFKMVNPETDIVELSDDISEWVGNTNTVAITAIQFAVYMGFKKIFLIGVDHSFSTYVNDKGEIINDNTVKDYFADEYNKDKEQLYMPNLDKSTRDFIVAKQFCDKMDVEIYNSTRGGKLEVFPRVNFDEAIRNIKG